MEVSAAGTGQAAKRPSRRHNKERRRRREGEERALSKQGPLFKVEGSGGDDAMDGWMLRIESMCAAEDKELQQGTQVMASNNRCPVSR